jgi:two-component system, NtrC family, sensor histidine kinase HydH
MRLMGPGLRPRVPDVFLAVMLGTLIYLAHDSSERSLIAALTILQLIEGRIPSANRAWLRTFFLVSQFGIVWLLVGYSGGIPSNYYLMFLLPLLSAALYSGFIATVAVSVAGIACSLSFLLFIDFQSLELTPEGEHVLAIRCLMLAIAAIAVNSLAAVIRTANKSLLEAEAAVRRSERLAALGQLSAGLAHELRNPLGSIKGSADLLARSAATKDPMTKELAGIISSEVDRTNSLVTRFLDFARPLEPRRETTDVTAVIDRAIEHARTDVTRDYSTTLPKLAIDPQLMEQVFLNLITNAAQASEPEPHVTVRTREIGKHAEISVIDQGCGIPADKIDTIFNPFVTTKRTGVGLGLAIVARIVDGHSGKMAVDSEPGKGSTFRVLLPIPPLNSLT